jgi:hypothetical protein
MNSTNAHLRSAMRSTTEKNLKRLQLKKLRVISYITTLLVAAFPFFSYAQSGGIAVTESNHGLYDIKISGKQKAPNTLTDSMNILSSQKLLLTTDTIVADIGKTFGVEFKISTGANNMIMPVTFVWEFPKLMKNPHNGKNYKTSEVAQYIITNQPMFNSYTLDYDYEFVEGVWKFKVLYNGVEIYKHVFWLMLPL